MKINYSNLDEELKKLEPNKTYNITVDCTGANVADFKGIETGKISQSKFGKKFTNTANGILFDLNIIFPEDLTDALYCFYGNNKIKSITIDSKNNLLYTKGMFYKCSNIESIDLSACENLTNAESMFRECSKLTAANNLFLYSLENANNMFNGCISLQEITISNLISLANSSFMFSHCSKLKKLYWGNLYSNYTFDDFSTSCNNILQDVAATEAEKCTVFISKNENIYNNIMTLFIDNVNIEVSFSKCPYPKMIKYDEIEYWDVDDHSNTEIRVYCKNQPASFFKGSESSKSDFYNKLVILQDPDYLLDLFFDVNDIEGLSDISYCFQNLKGYKSINILDSSIKKNKIKNISHTFYGCEDIVSVDTSSFIEATNASYAFSGCKKLNSLDSSKFKGVTVSEYMFKDCAALQTFDLSSMSNLSNAKGMFSGSGLTTISLNKTSFITNIESMFENCSQLESVTDTTSFSKLTSAIKTFNGCTSLKNVETNGLGKIENATYMFSGTNISSFDFSSMPNLINTGHMFENSNLTLGNDTNIISVTNAEYMFSGCKNIGEQISSLSFDVLENANHMFFNCINLKNIDLLGLSKLKNVSNMFENCASLAVVNWRELIPEAFTETFKGSKEGKTINVNNLYIKNWIDTNSTTMSLNATDEVVSPSIPSVLKFKEMDLWIPYMEPIKRVDASGKEWLLPYEQEIRIDVNNEDISIFKGSKNDQDEIILSPLAKKLFSNKKGVVFKNIAIDFPENVTDVSYCFAVNSSSSINKSNGPDNSISNVENFLFNQNKKCNITKTIGMFENNISLISSNTDCFSKVIEADGMFLGCCSFGNGYIPNDENSSSGESKEDERSIPVEIDLSYFSNTVSANNMFSECSKVSVFININLSSLKYANNMFKNCLALENLDCSTMFNILEANEMFYGCEQLKNIIKASFFNTVTANDMFYSCKSLQTLPLIENSFANVVNANNMFKKCENLITIDTSYFTKVQNASSMFYECKNMKHIDSVKFISLVDADNMFGKCSNLVSLNISLSNNIKKTSSMFSDCINLTEILLGSLDIKNIDHVYMFYNSNKQKKLYVDNVQIKKDINEEASLMKLINYDFIVNIPNSLNYNDENINKFIESLDPGVYSFTIDTSNTDPKKFIGTSTEPSAFGKTLLMAKKNVYFDIAISFKDDVTDLSYFLNSTNKQIPINSLRVVNAKNVVNTTGMLLNCKRLSSFNTLIFNKVLNTSRMFQGCSRINTIDVSSLTHVTNADKMFDGCSSLETIYSTSDNIFRSGATLKGLSIKTIYTNKYVKEYLVSSGKVENKNIIWYDTKENLTYSVSKKSDDGFLEANNQYVLGDLTVNGSINGIVDSSNQAENLLTFTEENLSLNNGLPLSETFTMRIKKPKDDPRNGEFELFILQIASKKREKRIQIIFYLNDGAVYKRSFNSQLNNWNEWKKISNVLYHLNGETLEISEF